MAESSGEKTHEATPERREEYRKEGRFAQARDAPAIAAVLGGTAAFIGTREVSVHALSNAFAETHGHLDAVRDAHLDRVLLATLGALSALTFPVALGAALGAIIVGLAQAGMRFDLSEFRFDLTRLNPVPRLARLVSPKTAAIETTLALARVSVVGYVAHRALSAELPLLLSLTNTPVKASLGVIGHLVSSLLFQVVGALAVLSLVDYAQSWWTLENEMKMSLQEIKEAMRQQEGDPRVKGGMRARARANAKKRMMQSVAKADVVVTNPTHLSVALAYRPGDAAPVVLAKGEDEVALQIRKEARRHGIPILESRPLARALYAEVPVGKAVPGAHYAAVARVLAFVYRLRTGSAA